MDHRRWEYYWIAVLILASFMVVHKSPEQRKHNCQVRRRERFAIKMQSHMKGRTKIVYHENGSVSLRPIWYRRFYYSKHFKTTIVIFSLTVVMMLVSEWIGLPVSFIAIGANKYWVDGSGDINDNTNHWSDSDGGSPGATLPADGDTIYFNGNSGTGTVNINQNTASVTMQHLTSNIAFSNGSAYSIYLRGASELTGTSHTDIGLKFSVASSTISVDNNTAIGFFRCEQNGTINDGNVSFAAIDIDSGKTLTIGGTYTVIFNNNAIQAWFGTLKSTTGSTLLFQHSTTWTWGGGTIENFDVTILYSGALSRTCSQMTVGVGVITNGDLLFSHTGAGNSTYDFKDSLTVDGNITDAYSSTGKPKIQGTAGKTITCSGQISIPNTTIVNTNLAWKSTYKGGAFTYTLWQFKDGTALGEVIVQCTSSSYKCILSPISTYLSLKKFTLTTGKLEFKSGFEFRFLNGETSTAASGTELRFVGVLGGIVTLRSQSTGNQWFLNADAGATVTVTYCDVKDSDALAGADIDATDGTSTNSGNNEGWLWPSAPASNAKSHNSFIMVAIGAI